MKRRCNNAPINIKLPGAGGGGGGGGIGGGFDLGRLSIVGNFDRQFEARGSGPGVGSFDFWQLETWVSLRHNIDRCITLLNPPFILICASFTSFAKRPGKLSEKAPSFFA